MSGRGRPLRFLALVGLAWTGGRVALLWSETGSLPEAIERLVPRLTPGVPVARAAPAAPTPAMAVGRPAAAPATSVSARHIAAVPGYDAEQIRIGLAAIVQYGVAQPLLAEPAPLPAGAPSSAPPGVPDRLAPLPDRWSASAWLFARAGSGTGAAPGGGQIGGSQAGMRLAYAILPRARAAAYARLAAPLTGKGREAAIGAEWQPWRAPVRLVAEQRIGLDGTPGGPGGGIVAGYDGTVRGFRLEAYGQAGAVLRRRAEPYADGAARATVAVAQDGAYRVALGAVAAGAAQRDAQRLDLGPSAVIAHRNIRVAIDWRQRVAGGAAPRSGPAMTIGADF